MWPSLTIFEPSPSRNPLSAYIRSLVFLQVQLVKGLSGGKASGTKKGALTFRPPLEKGLNAQGLRFNPTRHNVTDSPPPPRREVLLQSEWEALQKTTRFSE
ncbi:hypothetical protein NPIL_526071 [Nephila pilipes]|uniref:Uncharacterized protein n=1 Tax=Nephila pilipes TaxID=299642 RepID=A0A8X6U8N8_NEPPI|nr:hypothetical protein NPIL_526071 [Nephila pilipes]